MSRSPPPADLGLPEPEETAATFAGNAAIKADAAARASGFPALADDFGLAVAALDGAPGVHSARWAGADKDFSRAMRNVEEMLKAKAATTEQSRRAEFVCALCLGWPDGTHELFEGRVAGTLTWPPRGDKGFGYDPMFVPDGHVVTFGEMEPADKASPVAPCPGLRAVARELPVTMPGRGGGFGVYVHWPFCRAKCPYCDFNSHVRREAVDAMGVCPVAGERARKPACHSAGARGDQRVFRRRHALAHAAAGRGVRARGRRPTLGIARRGGNNAGSQPDQCRGEQFSRATAQQASTACRSACRRSTTGISTSLGRQHTAQEAIAAFRLAAGIFPRVSFDLIYARPGQTTAQWRRELSAALGEQQGHMSLYQLTIEEGTRYFDLWRAGTLELTDENLSIDLFDITQELASRAGLEAYEVSNHAAPGHESRHNLLYWRYGEYAGAGPGAHSRIVLDTGERMAFADERHPETWRELVAGQGHGRICEEPLSRAEQGLEFLLMGMRLSEGVALASYEAVAGRPLERESCRGSAMRTS